MGVGRYFGRQPRYSQQEAEAQAKQAIDAAVSKGRPPEEDWKPLASRMPDINRELATRPPVEIPPPPARRRGEGEADPGSARPRRPMNQILRPPSAPEPSERAKPGPKPAAAAPAKRATKGKRPAAAEAPAKAAKPAKPATRATKPAAPAAKRPAAKKRPR